LYDTLTKSAHFIPIKTIYQALEVLRVFVNEITRLYGVPKKIILDHGSMFTSILWMGFQKDLGT
jgi:hypothetical protein